MRVLMILAGAITASLGIFCSANAGFPFITVAFIVGLAAIYSGIIELLITEKVTGGAESKHWVRIEGITSIVLGVVFVSNQITEDIAVSSVFGLWMLLIGLRALTRVKDHYEKGSTAYYAVTVLGVATVLLGIYSFFNIALFNLDTLLLIGMMLLLQGVNYVRVAMLMVYKKPELIKTRSERLREAKRKAETAKKEAKEALIMAKEANDNLDKLYKERDKYNDIDIK